MLTETISGCCPVCGYTKLLQRYGSLGYTHLDGCANCGFGYMSQENNQPIGFSEWKDYALHVLSQVAATDTKSYDDNYKELSAYKDGWIRQLLYIWLEDQERYEDVETTIFKYKPEEIEAYKATNPWIFSIKGKLSETSITV